MMNRMTTFALTLIASLALIGNAGGEIIEMETNDLLADATPLGRNATAFADVGIINLSAGGGDVDVFSIDLFAGDFLMANTAGIASASIGSDPDTIISLVDPTGTIVEFDDDDSQSFGSNYTVLITTPGTYYVAVSGFGDSSVAPIGEAFGTSSFTGAHTEEGKYILTVSVVPSPAANTLAFLGLVACGVLRRRLG